jgi:hypothetical protein
MTPAPIVSSLATHPAYYALYALYEDYLLNNARHREREYFARLRDAIRYIQPVLGQDRYYMKSWSLRLFTERSNLARFTPEVASAAWRLVREMVDSIGAPTQEGPAPRTVRSDAPRRGTPEPRGRPTEPPRQRSSESSPYAFRQAV